MELLKPAKLRTARKAFYLDRHMQFYRMMGHVDYIIAPSQFVKTRMMNYFPELNKIHILHHGIHQKLISLSQHHRPGPIRVGYIEPFLRHSKGADTMVQAIRKIKSKNIEFRIYCHLTPSLVHNPYLLYALKYFKSDNIKLFDAFPHSEIYTVLTDLDVLVIPSLLSETFSYLLHEAFEAGVIPVCSNLGALQEFVQNGLNGFLFEPGNPRALEEILDKIALNPEILITMKKNRVTENSVKEYAHELKTIYGQLTQKKLN
jgi:glycosyltransferase involved in cell wall biosynthesis